jgi:cysteine desulfurase
MAMNDAAPIYLDNGATTRTDPAVVEAMLPYFAEDFGNASSLHRLGVRSRRALDAARQTIAGSIGATDREICFTSGGTESDTLAIRGAAEATRRRHMVMAATEHPAVLAQQEWLERRGFSVTVLVVDPSGRVTPEALLEATNADTALVSIMHANNEIGTLQDIDLLGPALKAHRPDALFFVDAVQSYTKAPIHVGRACIDLLSLSSHKIHGPKGVGALYIRDGLRLAPQVAGGSQEFGTRPGTENIPGIVGFAEAARLALATAPEDRERMRSLRDQIITSCEAELAPVEVNGDRETRLCNNANLNFPGARAEILLHMLEAKGLLVSSGAACHAGARKLSHVLQAIGLHEDRGTLRITLCRHTTPAEVDRAITILREVVPEARSVGGA